MEVEVEVEVEVVLCSNSKWRLVPEFQRKSVIIISLLLLNLICLSGFTRHLMPLNWRNDEYIILSNFGGRMISDLEVKERGLRAPSSRVAQ